MKMLWKKKAFFSLFIYWNSQKTGEQYPNLANTVGKLSILTLFHWFLRLFFLPIWPFFFLISSFKWFNIAYRRKMTSEGSRTTAASTIIVSLLFDQLTPIFLFVVSILVCRGISISIFTIRRKKSFELWLNMSKHVSEVRTHFWSNFATLSTVIFGSFIRMDSWYFSIICWIATSFERPDGVIVLVLLLWTR